MPRPEHPLVEGPEVPLEHQLEVQLVNPSVPLPVLLLELELEPELVLVPGRVLVLVLVQGLVGAWALRLLGNHICR